MDEHKCGDPEGRRLAKRQASLLSEAGQVARSLEVLLKRAGYDAEVVTELIEQMAKKEQIELDRGYGRIESRRRFRPHVAHPLLVQRPRSMLFIDENGKSKAEPNAPSQPAVFSLGAIAMPQEAVDDYQVAADAIKLEFFGRTQFTFHEPAMRHREGPYYFNGDRERQAEFDEAIDGLVGFTPFVAFGVGSGRKRLRTNS